jgi:hypothetical protein
MIIVTDNASLSLSLCIYIHYSSWLQLPLPSQASGLFDGANMSGPTREIIWVPRTVWRNSRQSYSAQFLQEHCKS